MDSICNMEVFSAKVKTAEINGKKPYAAAFKYFDQKVSNINSRNVVQKAKEVEEELSL